MAVLRMSGNSSTVIDVNLIGPFMLYQGADRYGQGPPGRIINIPRAGIYGNAGQTNYAAANRSDRLDTYLGQEVGGRGITVNAIAPGFVRPT